MYAQQDHSCSSPTSSTSTFGGSSSHQQQTPTTPGYSGAEDDYNFRLPGPMLTPVHQSPIAAAAAAAEEEEAEQSSPDQPLASPFQMRVQPKVVIFQASRQSTLVSSWCRLMTFSSSFDRPPLATTLAAAG
jgi:hypothetical protein